MKTSVQKKTSDFIGCSENKTFDVSQRSNYFIKRNIFQEYPVFS